MSVIIPACAAAPETLIIVKGPPKSFMEALPAKSVLKNPKVCFMSE